MRIAVLYLKIIQRTEVFPIATPYETGHKRFFNEYRKFKPGIPHDLIIVRCGGTEGATDFDAIATHYMRFDGWGSDCGAYQGVVRVLDYQFILCLNTLAYPCRYNWLEAFVEAFKAHGKGVYGASGSYEVHPHLRTPCIGFHPDVLREYPFTITNRGDGYIFEAGPNSVTAWAERTGYATIMVAPDGQWKKPDWRKPANVFRRGDQSNTYVRDRHFDVWDTATADEKKELSASADGANRK